MSNNTNISNLDHAPAQKVGGMRVKEPHVHRTPLKEEEAKDASVMKSQQDEADGREVLHDDEEQSNREEEENMRIRSMQERQAQDMQNHSASRQPDISKNPGTNLHQQYNSYTQPRYMNH